MWAGKRKTNILTRKHQTIKVVLGMVNRDTKQAKSVVITDTYHAYNDLKNNIHTK